MEMLKNVGTGVDSWQSFLCGEQSPKVQMVSSRDDVLSLQLQAPYGMLPVFQVNF